ncbi:META domain-containing protein [Leucobacter sp. Z1108]|uniref:META domain-containing protein n=1 Tax=Leucobacter sp. Z1108 TaxID=3439066 RepID=UPI003F32BAE1
MNHTLRSLLTAAAFAAAALTLVGCASGDTSKAQGTWGTANVTGEPWLVLEADGSFNGSDGCNGIFGAYTMSGDTVTLGDMGSTLMFCEGVDTWLSDASTARIDNNTMTVMNADSQEIGTLERTK